MSRNVAVLERATRDTIARRMRTDIEEPSGLQTRLGALCNLIRHVRTVSLISRHSDDRPSQICCALARELARVEERRSVVVPVKAVLTKNVPLPDSAMFQLLAPPNVWLWPAVGAHPERFEKQDPIAPKRWLDLLCQNFDTVLLDCPALDRIPSVAEIASLADAVILVAEAGQTSKQEIRRDQLRLSQYGANIVGSILTEPGQAQN